MADERNPYPLVQNPPAFADNPKLARQMTNSRDPDTRDRPFPLPGPTVNVKPFSRAGLGDLVVTGGVAGQARQAEIAARVKGPAASGHKPSSPPGDWD
jgi:hypothetical protein